MQRALHHLRDVYRLRRRIIADIGVALAKVNDWFDLAALGDMVGSIEAEVSYYSIGTTLERIDVVWKNGAA